MSGEASTPAPTPDPTPAPAPAPTPDPTPAPAPAPTPSLTPAPAPSPLGREQEQQQQQQDGPPEWLSALPEELRGDETLTRYKSVEEVARGLLENKRLARSKVQLPVEGDAESFARFAAAIRPEDMAAYEITVPDGQGSEFADAMRPVFHEAGLHPEQVKLLVAANNAYQETALGALHQKGADELAALEAEMGKPEFERGKQAAIQMLDRLGIKADFENDLARMIGAGNTLRTLFAMAEKTGELGRVHADDVSMALGNLKGEAAAEAARGMIRDPTTRAKLEDVNSPERKRYDALVKASGVE